MAKKSYRNRRRAVIGLVLLLVAGLLAAYLHGKNFAVLNPAGQVAHKERNLMFLTVGLGMAVIIPVYILLFSFLFKYREGAKKKARYEPEMDGNRWLETLWWGIPILIIGCLSVVTWQSSHALDPRKALDVAAKPLNVQVVALQWRWLFIYPAQGVASVNYLELPVNTPVNFDITADAPMNSFWIPQLGSQIYAMPGMQTQLHLVADKQGSYAGSSANLSGDGFAAMRFTANADSSQGFNDWVKSLKMMDGSLDLNEYRNLAQPSQDTDVHFYSSVDRELFNHVLLKYMAPGIN